MQQRFKNPTEKRLASFMETPGHYHLRKKIVNTLLFVQSVIKMKSSTNNPSKLMKLNLVIILIILVTSCDRRSNLKVDHEMEVSQALAVGNGDASSTPPKEALKQSQERKLIKNGTLSFETNDVEKTRKEIEKLYQEFNGYIASENHFNYGERLQHEQEIRIPAQNFDPFIQKLEQLGTKVENKNISTQDVTEEFIDVEARLKTKKDLEARYRELLKFAKKVDEMLSIENQIGNVRAEIESMEGRLNYLKNQVAFSTIKITYYELTGVDFGFASKFVHSLKNGWDNLLTFLIAMVNVWPFLILMGLGAVLYTRYKKSVRRMSA
jgi:Domain of unknown function (DUF4349)